MPAQKKQQIKKETTTENKPKTFSGIVTNITDRNDLMVIVKEDKAERVTMAYVDLPRFNKKENKEEMFAYECGEFLRKKLIGKSVKFEIVSEFPDGSKSVVPMMGSENIICSLLSLGYAVLKEGKGKRIEELVAATEKAKAEKKGFFSENPEKLCKKKPKDTKMTTKDIDFYVNKTLKGFIRKVETPAGFLIETEDRKLVRIQLIGVHPHTPFDQETNKFKFDAIATEAIHYVEKYFGLRDCEIKVIENGQKVRAVVKVGEKDIAEQLLLNGYVTLSIGNGDEELKTRYTEAETIAQNGKKGRYADEATIKALKEKKEKKEKAAEERRNNAKVVTGFVKFIGKYLRIEQEDGSEVSITLASVRPQYKKDDDKFNKNVEFRMRECIRRQIVGKKVECKLAYTSTFKKDDKETKEDHYDVYANGKNIAIQLLKEGIVTLDNKKQSELKQSFDFQQFKQTQGKEFKVIPTVDYTSANIANVKDAFVDQVMNGVIEKVISLNKYLVYIPTKECTITVTINNCRLPKATEESKAFTDKARDVITKLIQYQDVTVEFKDFFKGNMYGDVLMKGTGSIQTYLIEKGYMIPTGKVVLSAEVEEMKANKTQIYQFEEEKQVKEVTEEEKKPKRIHDVKFGNEEKIFLTGFDGHNIYYYIQEEETKFIEELNNEMKSIKRGKFDLKLGKGYAVEYKNKLYRAEILSMNNGANLVKCVDTGATIVVGKNKIKAIPEELANKEVKVLSKKLIGIKPLSLKDAFYKTMLELVAEYYNKEAMMSLSNDEAKVVIGDVCLNIHLIAQGLSLIDRRFFDKGEFGLALKAAENQAKDAHLNAWQYGEIFDEDDKERN